MPRSFLTHILVCLALGVMLSLLPGVAAAKKCEDQFRPIQVGDLRGILTQDEVRALTEAEFATYVAADAELIASIVANTRFSTAQASTKVSAILRQNSYLEQRLTYKPLNELAHEFTMHVASADTIRAAIVTRLIRIRINSNGLRTMQRPKLASVDINGPDFEIQRFDHFNLHRFNSLISYEQLKSMVPRIERKWSPIFDIAAKPFPEVLHFELAELPGTFIVLFSDFISMNIVFQRATRYIEQKEEVPTGHEIYGMAAAGHDLRGEDLLRFWGDRHHGSHLNQAGEVIDMSDYRRRLAFESEFFRGVIQPMIHKRGAENVVFLAASSDMQFYRAITHEVWHAKYFKDRSWRRLIQAYWARLPEQQKREFKKVLGNVGYDINNESLTANEFQAYMLQEDDDAEPPGFYDQLRRELRPAFLKAIEAWKRAGLVQSL